MKINLNLLRQPLGFSWRMAFLYRSWKDAAPNHRHYQKDKISRSDNAYFEIRVPQFIMPTFEKCLPKDISMDLKSWDWRLLISMPTVAWCCVPIRLHLLEHWNISQDSAPPHGIVGIVLKKMCALFTWTRRGKPVWARSSTQTMGPYFNIRHVSSCVWACIEPRLAMFRTTKGHVLQLD